MDLKIEKSNTITIPKNRSRKNSPKITPRGLYVKNSISKKKKGGR